MQVYAEGTHLMVPWFMRPIIYDVRARPNVITSTSGSRDLQMVSGRDTGSSAWGGSTCYLRSKLETGVGGLVQYEQQNSREQR